MYKMIRLSVLKMYSIIIFAAGYLYHALGHEMPDMGGNLTAVEQ
jgi:hypothetical protein